MTNLANVIYYFQIGALSQEEFLAQVDSALSTDDTNTVRLHEFLSDEHTRVQLPPEVYAELCRKLGHPVSSRQTFGGEETRVQTNPRDRWTSRSEPGGPPIAPEVEPERMKGVGETLNGRFVLEECIGFGGMGTVYKALDLRKLEASDRKPYIAIKVLNVQFRGHPKSLIALQREARKAQSLAHPNIVAVYDFDRDGAMVYLTMEYLSGKPLSQLLRASGFAGMPYADAMKIVNGIGKALGYAHERGFVHCDLKPANVFVTDNGVVKVIDFGIARIFRKSEEDAEATVFDPGSLGALTPAYASPEMLEHLEPDPRDDIYAMACITYELLTGKHPFDRLSALQARGAGMKVQRHKNLGHRQWRALKHALAFERQARTPTVARFVQEISVDNRPRIVAEATAAVIVIAGITAAAIHFYPRSQPGNEPPSTTAATTTAETKKPPASAPPQVASVPSPPPPFPALSLAEVTPMLSSIPCSALVPSVHEHDLKVQGFLSSSFGETKLKEKLAKVPGMSNLNVDVQQVSDDKCRVVQEFAPFWTRNRLADTTATIRTRAANAELTEGDALIVDITTPPYDSYVYVDYYVLDGSVAHLVPNPQAKANQAPASYKASIGGLGNWVISKPFGTEMIVLLITPVPLFDTVRPASEPAADYLRAVDHQLQQLAAKHGRDKIVADVVQITTKAKKP